MLDIKQIVATPEEIIANQLSNHMPVAVKENKKV